MLIDNKPLFCLSLIFLVMLGIKWFFDYSIERRRAEVDCFGYLLRQSENVPANSVPVFTNFCVELWGKEKFVKAIEDNKNAEKLKNESTDETLNKVLPKK